MGKTLTRRLKTKVKDLMRTAFEVGQRFKVDILPRHFYSEIPDIRLLKSTHQWKLPRTMTAVQGDADAQLAWAQQCLAGYSSPLKDFEIHAAAVKRNGSDEGYGEIEADFLYCFVRSVRPARVVQIGCGVSTAVLLRAAQDAGYSPEITCIEPYPTPFLLKEAAAGNITLVAKKVEDVGADCVAELASGDLFFVDSSHTLAPAGEVNLLVLEMLPRLAPGVYAHFHDIYFPYDYSPYTLSGELFFFHETALLYAFLTMNSGFEIAASLAMLWHERPEEFKKMFPAMQPAQFDAGLMTGTGNFATSTYIRRLP